MHLPENYLSPTTCAVMAAAMLPVWKRSISKVKIQIEKRHDTVPMIGIASALSFLIMMFNFPVPGGTTAHAVGGTLLAILLGPEAACLTISITLLIQATMFGDGGILAFGANAFNMAFIMPYLGFGIYSIFAKKHHDLLGAAIGSYFGILFAALFTGIELGIQPLLFHSSNGVPKYFPYGLNVTVPTMLSIHAFLVGIVEVALTVAIYAYIRKISTKDIYLYSDNQSNNKSGVNFLITLICSLVVLVPFGLLASGSAWGEWSDNELLKMIKQHGISNTLPSGMTQGFSFSAPFGDYQITNIPSQISYVMIAATVVLVTLIIVKVNKHETKQ